MTLIHLNLSTIVDLNHQQLLEISQSNRHYHFERSSQGELIISAPLDRQTQQWIWAIASQLWTWNQQTGLGVTFDSLTLFELPNRAIRSPHLAWIESSRWAQFTDKKRDPVLNLCPNFVVELLSPHDTWENLQTKMKEYQQHGSQLGWSIDPILKIVEIYKSDGIVQQFKCPDCLSGERILPGFLLDFQTIFP